MTIRAPRFTAGIPVGAPGLRRGLRVLAGVGAITLTGFLLYLQLLRTLIRPAGLPDDAYTSLWSPGLVAALAGVLAVSALAGVRWTRTQVMFLSALALWLAAPWLRSLLVTGERDGTWLTGAFTLFAIALALQASSPLVVGWLVSVAGMGFLALNWKFIFDAYRSRGELAPGVIRDPDTITTPGADLVDVMHDLWSRSHIVMGLTANSTQTALWVAVGVMAAVAFLASLVVRQPWPVAVRGLLVAATAAPLVPAYALADVLRSELTRYAVVAFAVGLALWLLPLHRLPVLGQRVVAGATVALGLVGLFVPPIVAANWQVSFNARDCIWNAVRERWATDPFWGPGSGVAVTSSCSSAKISHAHNDALQSWWLGGLPGLLGFALVFGVLLWLSVRRVRQTPALFAFMVGMVVLSAVDAPLLLVYLDTQLALPVVIFLAFTAAAVRQATAGAAPPPPDDPVLAPAGPEARAAVPATS